MFPLTLELTADIERGIQARAKDRGQDLGAIAIEILERALAEPAKTTSPSDLPYEVWRERFHAMLKDLPLVDVVVDDSRESIYEGRGE
ncbi:MAG: hypothetical protein EXR98_10305 [Gemmataceae bacterium]|nr:hypothetical protein [Gemmataceae bacterium]